MTSMPMSFAIGATVISLDSLKKLSEADQKTVEEINRSSAKKLRKVIRKLNEDSKGTMTRQGVTVVPMPSTTVDEFAKQAAVVQQELAGKVYSKDELAMVLKYRDEYRAKNKKP
jgi:TRAP-type C4-dicarboxylate transport system substrate-binding protein